MRIPSHILYPGMILGLLGFSISICTILVLASRSDGGPQVIPDYYVQSVEWDERESVRQASRALGWTLDVSFDRHDEGQVRVTDGQAQPVVGLDGSVRLRRPQLADDVTVAALVPVDGEPGLYRFEHPPAAPGFWDLVLEGEFQDQPVHLTQRHRVR